MNSYKYFPETREDLRNLIKERIKDEGTEIDLNDIDVSRINDMSHLFEYLDFNGDISKWDVSNVTNMWGIFYGCENFNQDISGWDVSNVTDMWCMFNGCKEFNQDISKWNVSKVKYMIYMFYDCEDFNQDISGWDVSNVTDMSYMFCLCPIKDEFKPKFKK